eukprot:4805947-Amphidinium_carterae.3
MLVFGIVSALVPWVCLALGPVLYNACCLRCAHRRHHSLGGTFSAYEVTLAVPAHTAMQQLIHQHASGLDPWDILFNHPLVVLKLLHFSGRLPVRFRAQACRLLNIELSPRDSPWGNKQLAAFSDLYWRWPWISSRVSLLRPRLRQKPKQRHRARARASRRPLHRTKSQ